MDWKEWRNRSQNGEVCGLLGCEVVPKNKCPICNNFYCLEHIKIHYHIGKGGYEALEKN